MKVRIKLFAVARERLGRDVVEVELPTGATIAELKRAVGSEYPALGAVLSHALWAINAEYATDTTLITDQSEIALIPPVSGG
jgi:molybdopterin converting factor subunit 1